MAQRLWKAAALLGSAGVLSWAESELRLENRELAAELRAADGSVRLLDKRTGAWWDLRPPRIVLDNFTSVTAKPGGAIERGESAFAYRSAGVEFRLALTSEPPAVEYSCRPLVDVAEVRLISESLRLETGPANYYAIPKKMGVLAPVEGAQPSGERLQGYGDAGYTMAMFGAVQNGSALLATWHDFYADLIVNYTVQPRPRLALSLASVYRGPAASGFVVVPGRLATAGMAPRRERRAVLLQPLGRGGYVEIARAYRTVARRHGYLKTLAEKLRENPSTERLFGAADFKVFAFSRTLPGTRWNPSDTERVRVNFSFEQCAELAEHLGRDLGIDRALFVVNGWIRRGYDNQHPDVLPAAAEAGGNESLSACGRRVKAMGWLFGLHDNYQNLYKDAPSWDEKYIMKKADGSLFQRGVWAGGPAYLICSKMQMAFARRNLPLINELFAPTVYFSDQLFAAPLYECFDREHPLSRADDMRYKLELSRYIRRTFGLFGSEDGQEWAVPDTDYFEGLMAHKTRYRKPDSREIVIPLFELVYGDAIPIYTHQSDRPRPDHPTYILDHILYAEMPVYYFGEPGYWKDPAKDFRAEPDSKTRLVFAQGGRFGLIDQFIKNTYEVLSPLNRITALLPMTEHRFLTADRKVESTRFGTEVEITVNYGPADYATPHAVLPQYGFLIESPSLVAFYARAYRGRRYGEPPLVVLRSLDGRPLESSRRVRIYRGFGDRRVQWRGRLVEVDSEKVIDGGS